MFLALSFKSTWLLPQSSSAPTDAIVVQLSVPILLTVAAISSVSFLSPSSDHDFLVPGFCGLANRSLRLKRAISLVRWPGPRSDCEVRLAVGLHGLPTVTVDWGARTSACDGTRGASVD